MLISGNINSGLAGSLYNLHPDATYCSRDTGYDLTNSVDQKRFADTLLRQGHGGKAINEAFLHFLKQRRALNKPMSGDSYAIERSDIYQDFNQQWLDQIMPEWEKRMKIEGLLK